jgi:hypothetical protein
MHLSITGVEIAVAVDGMRAKSDGVECEGGGICWDGFSAIRMC